MSLSTLKRAFNFPWKEAARDLIVNTPAEIYIGAFLFSIPMMVGSYVHENEKQGQIPLAFSEIGQTRFMLGLHKLPVPPLTEEYSSTNDVPMMVFEASNLSYNWNRDPKSFGYELEKKVDPGLRIHTLISDYAPRSEATAKAALNSLTKIVDANRDVQPIIEELQNTWDESHDDVYKTVMVSVEKCESDGKEEKCHTEQEPQQVYDYTIHTYDYHRKHGEKAAALLKDFMVKYPDVKIAEALLLVPKTNAENEWAMRESRRKLPGYKPLVEADYMRLTNVWATGSNFHVLMPKVEMTHKELAAKNPEWKAATLTAKDYRYETGSHSDSGPEEYRVASAALDYATQMSGSIERITGGIEFSGKKIPVLNQKIIQFVNVTQHGEKGDAHKLKNEIMTLARQIYKLNFANGLDTEPAKWGHVVLWGVFGALLGGLLGKGVDHLIDGRVQQARRREQSQASASRGFN